MGEARDSIDVAFGRYTISARRRELLADGERIELGDRAFDVLMTLVAAAGRVVSKDELISRVWAGRIVEESSLEAHISALRRALGPDKSLVLTVAGRGYQFTGRIERAAVAGAPSATSPTNLPERLSDLVGREIEVTQLAEFAQTHRLITLVGAGGVGKSQLGFQVARRLLPSFADGVWLAELGPLSDPDLVPVTVANALGLTLQPGLPTPEAVASALGTRQVVLVLDNCEHVIDIAARVAESVLRADSRALVLATSREPLRLPGELIYRVPSLEVPAEGQRDEEAMLAAGAVRLFIARARAAASDFAPDQRATEMVAAICRRLDGIPLAIELAAASTAALGVEELGARLDDRFALLTGGLRTALPRHRTLQATLDWSYELLPELQRVLLRRLAIFAGAFSLDAATAVAGLPGDHAMDVLDGVSSLIAKSLLAVSVAGSATRYRLLETTRAYALDKLTRSGERQALARRHAEYFRAMFEAAAAEWQVRSRDGWLEAYGHHLDNVRAALDWASSVEGDAQIGAALTVAAVPLWWSLSLIAECAARAEEALSASTQQTDGATLQEMRLCGALAGALFYTKGPVEEVSAAFTRALEIAERLADTEYQLRARFGLWTCRVNVGKYRAALGLAEAFIRVAAEQGRPVDALIGEHLVGRTLHFLGDQERARGHVERMLAAYVAPARRSELVRFQSDQRVLARSTLARILWVQGFPDRAMQTARAAVEDAQAVDHFISVGNALAHAACPIALLNGDLVASERFIEMLIADAGNRLPGQRRSTRYVHPVIGRDGLVARWLWGEGFQGMLLLQRDAIDAAVQRLSSAVDEMRVWQLLGLHFVTFLAQLARALGAAGRGREGLAAANEALERSEHNEERWNLPELLRVKGELLLLTGTAEAAEECWMEALLEARRRKALSWELRCATSLAGLWREQGQAERGRALLAPVYGRFSEGFDTADLTAARALLAPEGDAPRPRKSRQRKRS